MATKIAVSTPSSRMVLIVVTLAPSALAPCSGKV
jgi:hypothetical protein